MSDGTWTRSVGLRFALAVLAAVPSACRKPAAPPPSTVSVAPDPPQECGRPGATPLRLLTRAEYDNTVRDLLGDTSHPSKDFPREPLAHGLDNDANLNQAGDEGVTRYLEAAEALSATAVRDRKSLFMPCQTSDEACAEQFITTFGRRAFRRPLTAGEQANLLAFFDATQASQAGFDPAVEWTLQVLLQSPQFLYRAEQGQGPLSQLEVELGDDALATRLSYLIWASTPDPALLDAADRGELRTLEGLRAQAQRLLDDPRAVDGQLRFFTLFFNTDGIALAEKDVTTWPAWTPALSQAWQQSTELFLRDVISHEDTVAALFTKDVVYANDRMQQYVPGKLTPAFERVAMGDGRRAGILTQPGAVARLAAPDQSSPIRRGIFVLDRVMCEPPPPPPPGLAVVPPPPAPGLTTRERFAAHTGDPACSGCHSYIDPPGFAFEHFDGLGAWRDVEQGKPIDATGGIVTARDQALVGPVDGAVELSRKLAASPQVHDCFAQEYLRFALGRSLVTGDSCSLGSVQKRFRDSGGSFRELVLAIVESDAFARHQNPEVGP